MEPLLGPDKLPLGEDMSGTARQQAYAASGRQLYTLYAQPRDADLAAAPNVASESFVHVLDLAENWAYCVDLPESFGRGSARSAGITLDPDGASLYVADTRAGKLAVLDTGALDRNHLINDQPRIKVVKLPRSVPRNDAITLATTDAGIVLDTATAHFTYDPVTGPGTNCELASADRVIRGVWLTPVDGGRISSRLRRRRCRAVPRRRGSGARSRRRG